MGTLWQDVRYGMRTLLKRPAFTVVAVVALALGIGANTAIFSIVYAVLLRPLPFKEPERLVVVFDKQPSLETAPASFPEFDDWRKQSQAFEEMAALFHNNFNLTGTREPERVRGALVSENYFSLFGSSPMLGRSFSADDHRPGAQPVVVLSQWLWQTEFGASPEVMGQTLTLNGTPYTVIGVMPATAPSLSSANKTALWVPLERELPWKDRGAHFLNVFARLKPGVSLERAQAEMNLIAERLEGEYHTGHSVRLTSFKERLVGDVRPHLLLLLGAVGLVLLIACANVANLLLARATARSKEFAIRAALGASRLRLIRQLLTESVLLALLGGVAGTLLALWATDVLVASWPARLPRPDQIGVDWRVLGFTAAVTLLTGLVFGLAPALFATRTDLNESIRESSSQTTTGARRNRVRHLLVVSELALATMLLLGAGLMLKSFWLLRGVDPGFRPENVLTVQVSLQSKKYLEEWQRASFFREVLERTEGLPGVEAAGAINNLPLGGGGMNGDFELEGRPPFPQGQEPMTEKYIASAGYARAMGIRLLKGRFISEQDTAESPAVVVINEAMARRFWPDADPLGQRLSWGGNNWRTIVGVVGDVRNEGLETSSGFQSYVPYTQAPPTGMTIVVRAAEAGAAGANAQQLAAEIRRQVQAVDPEQPVFNIKLLDAIVADSVGGQRLTTLLLSIFGALALVLASVGIYGVLSYSVAQRTHEIGIRMALGAQSRDILKMVLGQGLLLTLSGVALGLLAAFALTRVMASLLYGVTATDPLTFAAASLVLILVALLATIIPAHRATRVDPLEALRYE
ncbi:MAG TPA: ABC transporter permease [Pyrinomonadaceae bacterium]|jgi:putative ABC transport system permease protein